MDPSTSALIAGTGLTVAVLAVIAVWVALRAVRRRQESQLRLLHAAQERLEAQIHLLDTGASNPPAEPSPERSLVPTRPARPWDDTEIVDAEIVEDEGTPASAPLASAASDTPAGRSLDGRLVADLVIRETLVRTVSLAHGLRHALSARTRHRIRFEMGREVKRSRAARKDEVKVAVREYRARERARMVAEQQDGENVA